MSELGTRPEGPRGGALLAEVLLWAAKARARARVAFVAANGTHTLFFGPDSIEGVVLAQGHLSLTQVLLERGWIDDAALDRALEEVYGGTPLEQALVSTGALSQERLSDALSELEWAHLDVLGGTTEATLETTLDVAHPGGSTALPLLRALHRALSAPGAEGLRNQLLEPFNALGMRTAPQGALALAGRFEAELRAGAAAGWAQTLDVESRSALAVEAWLGQVVAVDLVAEAAETARLAREEALALARELARSEELSLKPQRQALRAASSERLGPIESQQVATQRRSEQRHRQHRLFWEAARAVEAAFDVDASVWRGLPARDEESSRINRLAQDEATRVASIEAAALALESSRVEGLAPWRRSLEAARGEAERVVASEEAARLSLDERQKEHAQRDALCIESELEAARIEVEARRREAKRQTVLAEAQRVVAELRLAASEQGRLGSSAATLHRWERGEVSSQRARDARRARRGLAKLEAATLEQESARLVSGGTRSVTRHQHAIEARELLALARSRQLRAAELRRQAQALAAREAEALLAERGSTLGAAAPLLRQHELATAALEARALAHVEALRQQARQRQFEAVVGDETPLLAREAALLAQGVTVQRLLETQRLADEAALQAEKAEQARLERRALAFQTLEGESGLLHAESSRLEGALQATLRNAELSQLAADLEERMARAAQLRLAAMDLAHRETAVVAREQERLTTPSTSARRIERALVESVRLAEQWAAEQALLRRRSLALAERALLDREARRLRAAGRLLATQEGLSVAAVREEELRERESRRTAAIGLATSELRMLIRLRRELLANSTSRLKEMGAEAVAALRQREREARLALAREERLPLDAEYRPLRLQSAHLLAADEKLKVDAIREAELRQAEWLRERKVALVLAEHVALTRDRRRMSRAQGALLRAQESAAVSALRQAEAAERERLELEESARQAEQWAREEEARRLEAHRLAELEAARQAELSRLAAEAAAAAEARRIEEETARLAAEEAEEAERQAEVARLEAEAAAAAEARRIEEEAARLAAEEAARQAEVARLEAEAAAAAEALRLEEEAARLAAEEAARQAEVARLEAEAAAAAEARRIEEEAARLAAEEAARQAEVARVEAEAAAAAEARRLEEEAARFAAEEAALELEAAEARRAEAEAARVAAEEADRIAELQREADAAAIAELQLREQQAADEAAEREAEAEARRLAEEVAAAELKSRNERAAQAAAELAERNAAAEQARVAEQQRQAEQAAAAAAELARRRTLEQAKARAPRAPTSPADLDRHRMLANRVAVQRRLDLQLWDARRRAIRELERAAGMQFSSEQLATLATLDTSESAQEGTQAMSTEDESRARRARLRRLGMINTGLLARNEPSSGSAAPPSGATPAASPSSPPTAPGGTPSASAPPPAAAHAPAPAAAKPHTGPVAALSPEDQAHAREIQQKATRAKTEDHFVRLGVTKSATPDQIKQAFFVMAKKFHPDKLPESLAHLKAEADGVFALVRESYEVLSNDKSRADYLANLGKPPPSKSDKPPLSAEAQAQAQVARNQGEAALKKKQFGEALDAFKKAYGLDPRPADLAAQAWALYLDPARRQDLPTVRTLLSQAFAGEPDGERAHYVSGVVARAANQPDVAEKHFRAVLKRNPGHHDAQLELRLLERRKGDPQADAQPAKKKGIFGL